MDRTLNIANVILAKKTRPVNFKLENLTKQIVSNSSFISVLLVDRFSKKKVEYSVHIYSSPCLIEGFFWWLNVCGTCMADSTF